MYIILLYLILYHIVLHFVVCFILILSYCIIYYVLIHYWFHLNQTYANLRIAPGIHGKGLAGKAFWKISWAVDREFLFAFEASVESKVKKGWPHDMLSCNHCTPWGPHNERIVSMAHHRPIGSSSSCAGHSNEHVCNLQHLTVRCLHFYFAASILQVRPYAFTEAPRSIAAGGLYGVMEYAGSIPRPYAAGEDAKFSRLRGVLTDNEAAQLLSTGSQFLSEEIGSGRGRELDPVDGRPRFAVEIAEYGVLSTKCAPQIRPLLETVLLPLVRQKYECPTASLSSAHFRRFVPEERRYVPPHHEHGSFAVLAIALQEPTSYTGGFFVQGSGKAFLDRRFIELSRGDVCLFQHDLCHGVDIQEGSQLELVLHFKDSPQAVADGTSPWYWLLNCDSINACHVSQVCIM